MSTGKEGKSNFPTFRLLFQCSYVLHTLKYAPRPQARFWYFDFCTPEIRVEIWRVTVATAAQTTSFFLSIFSDSSFFFKFNLRRKTVVRNENRPIRGGLIFIATSNIGVQLGISELHPRADGLSGNQTLKGKTNGKFVNLGVRNSEWHKEPLACGRCLRSYVIL